MRDVRYVFGTLTLIRRKKPVSTFECFGFLLSVKIPALKSQDFMSMLWEHPQRSNVTVFFTTRPKMSSQKGRADVFFAFDRM
jgi:hypothetical protein